MVGDPASGEPETERLDRSVRRLSRGLSLERFDDPRLLSAGKVNLIALDTIVEGVGARRAPEIHRHAEMFLERAIGESGRFLRISPTDVLICHPALSRGAGQAACRRYLQEIHDHFLGDQEAPVDAVHAVTSITAEGVEAVRCDPAEARTFQDEPPEAEIGPDDAAAGDDRWAPFVATDGRRVRVSCALEPIFELKAYERIGFRLARRVIHVETGDELSPAAIAGLSGGDILKIDRIAVGRGLDRLRVENAEAMALSIVVPVSAYSLSSQRGRADLVSAFKAARSLVQRGVICEICDIEGVARDALAAAIQVIKPFCLFVVGRRQESGAQGLRALKGVGFQALSLECPPGMPDAELIGWGKANIEPARRITRSVLVYRADSARAAGMAAMMGATHATLRAELKSG